ncbi:MAG: glycosyl transferase family 1 [Chloroflexi bacterium RBG_16_54_18]|nr:MAG: glycosyl transferase family 1 [Chloroflexi bacterium RBG_16_54_18]
MPDNHCNIGFVSTRFQGNDGVSLETEKWLEILLRMNYQCFLFGGDCDEHEIETSYLVPEAHFKHPEIQAIYNQAFTLPIRSPELSRRIQLLKDHLKAHLYLFVKHFSIQLLIVENALTIPLNLPLGVAITEFIAETGIPTIAHHHDFFWERKHFLVNCVWDYLNMAFPPHLPSIHHVVINSSGANQLALRTGNSAMMIPNVMDFDHPPPAPDEYTRSLRADMGVAPDEYFILQPTRIVQRKGIEHAIEMVHRLGKKARLVISHASGDEGDDYESRVRNYAQLLDVPTNFVTELIRDRRAISEEGSKIYTLWDTYQKSDFVTYPSTIEGFGNAFLEAIYFRKAVLVNNYSIFSIDIKPKGFRVIEFDGYITDATVNAVGEVLETPAMRDNMVEHNYYLGKQYYSYTVLTRRLETLLSECLGEMEC